MTSIGDILKQKDPSLAAELAVRASGRRSLELREITINHTPGGTLLEFASKLESHVGPVKLDGDPHI